jgi:hypothetical protein
LPGRKKKRRWPLLLAAILSAAILLWIFHPAIESWLRPARPARPAIGTEKVEEEIREEERQKLEQILKERR